MNRNRNRSRLFTPDFPFAPARLPVFFGWLILPVSVLGLISTIPGQTMGFSVFSDVLVAELGLSRVQLSAAYFIGTVCSGLILPWGGIVLDRMGQRKAGVSAALGLGIAVLFLSRSDRFSHGIAAWFDHGNGWLVAFVVITIGFFLVRFFGQGMLMMSCQTMMGKWFRHYRGRVLAISGVAVSLTFSIAPKWMSGLIDIFGWRGAWEVMAVWLVLGMATLAWLVFRDNPEECGLIMDGRVIEEKEESRNPDLVIYKEYTREEALRTKAFWIFVATSCFFTMLITGYTFHVLSIGEEFGLEKDEILGFFPYMALTGMMGTFFTGWVSDKTRIKYILIFITFSLCMAMVGTLFMPSMFGRVMVIGGMGMGIGCLPTLLGITWPRFYGRQHLGAISGYAMSKMVITSAMGPLLFSLSKDYLGGYRTMFVVSIALTLILTVMGFGADNPQRKLAEQT